MKKVAVFLADGFEEIEAVCIADVLRRAGIHVALASITGCMEVKGSHDIQVRADYLFENLDFSDYDMIVLPGGIPGALNLNAHSGVRKVIIDFNTTGKILGAICAAPLVFGDLNILEDRDATCYPGFDKYLSQARVKTEAVVEDHNIVTGNGPAAALQFALRLVEKLTGKESAEIVAGKMLLKSF